MVTGFVCTKLSAGFEQCDIREIYDDTIQGKRPAETVMVRVSLYDSYGRGPMNTPMAIDTSSLRNSE